MTIYTGTAGDDVLTVSVTKGPFTWNAGAGYDTLRIDFSAATDYVFSSAGLDTFSFHAQQWASLDFATVSNVEALNIMGSRFNDYFIGGAYNDVLRGGDGNDVLNPGTGGVDFIDGGAGFDKIELTFATATVNIIYDATQAATAYGGRLFNGTIVKNVEGINFIQTGTGNDKLIVATQTKDFIWNAGGGNDVLVADYSSADAAIRVTNVTSPIGLMTRITGGAMTPDFGGEGLGIEQLFITGSRFTDDIQGTWGQDRLDGGLGADRLEGQKGDDTYVVEDIHDVVIELAGQGTDTVVSSRTWQLGANVENLTLTGHTAINGIGNDLDNRITGNDARNILLGNAGNDILDGCAGNDVMSGGFGNDVYYVDSPGDIVSEAYAQGTDAVVSTVDYSLSGRYVENLVLGGLGNVYGFGNDLDNRIVGNAGDNRIVGGRGNDALTGGKGADSFAFAAGSGRDTITDFKASEGDTLDLNAYHAKATTVISQHGADTWIDLGNGNVITLTNVLATDAGFLSHIIW